MTGGIAKAWAVLVGGGAAASCALLFTLAQVVDPSAGVGAMLATWTAKGQASAATAAMRGDLSSADRSKVRQLAEQALRREPANVVAVRTLGLLDALDGRERPAARAMVYAERLSRRDLPTELWFIEDRVRRGDVAGALSHYDYALRTNRAAGPLLLPVLVRAANDAAVARDLGKVLAPRPSWWQAFAVQYFPQAQSADATAAIFASLRLDVRDQNHRALLGAGLSNIVREGHVADAYRLYQRFVNARGGVADGGFNNDRPILPFDWYQSDAPDLNAVREQRRGGREGDMVLTVSAASGRSGIAAQQLVQFGPGRYLVSAEGGDMPADAASRPVIRVTCVANDKQLVQLSFENAGAGASRQAFVVPDGCPTQWLAIWRSAPLDMENLAPWLDNIDIRRLP